MAKFKTGDKVIQIKNSLFKEHDFPPEEYPVLTVNLEDGCGLMFLEQGDRKASGHDAERFELITNVQSKLAGLVPTANTKDTNPKDAVGTKKPPMSTVSGPVLREVGVAMLEGALKYGRHNYREAGVRASVYYDAALRHLISYWEGEDIDPESGVSHLTKAIAGLAVLRDAEINNKVTDDRPPRISDLEAHTEMLQNKVEELLEKYPDPVPACVHAK